MKILSLLLGISYTIPNMLSFKFQRPSIKIEDVCRDGVREKAIYRAWPVGSAKKIRNLNNDFSPGKVEFFVF